MVKVVTDSVADLPAELCSKFDITVIPLLLRFGRDEFRDGIDISSSQFYERLRRSADFPTTSLAPPGHYAEVYDRVAEGADAILAITVSGQLTGAYDVARRSRDLMKHSCTVEVLDSSTATMAEGFIALRAAQAAQKGASLEEAIRIAEHTRERVDFLCTFDTLDYLKRGGRIGAASAYLGSLLKINPMITIRDGVVAPAGKTRSRTKAVDRLVDFVSEYRTIEELAVGTTDCAEEGERLVERLGVYFPPTAIYRSTMTPVIGAHTGPGLLLVCVLGDRQ